MTTVSEIGREFGRFVLIAIGLAFTALIVYVICYGLYTLVRFWTAFARGIDEASEKPRGFDVLTKPTSESAATTKRTAKREKQCRQL